MPQRGTSATQPIVTRGETASGIYGMNTSVSDSHTSLIYEREINFEAIGKKLRAERNRIGKTQEQIAEIIGITPAFVGHLERAERSMSLDTLIRFCNIYRITIDYLLSDTLPPVDENAVAQIADILKDKTSDQQAAILDILRTVTRHI